jgi:site-specific recombinase XerD
MIGVFITNKKYFNPDDIDVPIRKNEIDSVHKNRLLKGLKKDLEEIVDVLTLNKETPTAELVRERYNALHNNRVFDTDKGVKVNHYFVVKKIDEYLEDAKDRVAIGDGLRKSSYQKIERILKKWKSFFEVKGLSSIQFIDLVNRQGLFKEFAIWCLEKDNNFANSSINKYNTTFRGFMRWAHKKDFHNIDLFRFDSPHLKESSNRSILALSPEQLKEIFSFKGFNYLDEDGNENVGCLDFKNKNDRNYIVKDEWVSKKYLYKTGDEFKEKWNSKTYTSLEVYKDFFCFLCSTSLAYIDAANLRISNYQPDEECFVLVRHKTSTPVRIPLNDMSRRIWYKYSNGKNGKEDKGRPLPNHFLFPRVKEDKFYSNQNCNYGLKTIGRRLKDKLNNFVNVELRAGDGVKEGSDKEVPLYTKLHTHMGRKTFISFAFSEKISTVDIAKVTGHSSEQILKHYVNSMRDEVKEEFQMVNSFVVNKDDILLTRAQKKQLMNKEEVGSEKNESSNAKSHKERLLELKDLLEEGLLNKKEYESKRKLILNEI